MNAELRHIGPFALFLAVTMSGIGMGCLEEPSFEGITQKEDTSATEPETQTPPTSADPSSGPSTSSSTPSSPSPPAGNPPASENKPTAPPKEDDKDDDKGKGKGKDKDKP